LGLESLLPAESQLGPRSYKSVRFWAPRREIWATEEFELKPFGQNHY
jgi:hypothetical protein